MLYFQASMELIKLLCDRAVFLLMLVGYVAWKNTTGPSHWAALVSKFGDFELVLVGTMVVSTVFYAAFSGIFALIDLVMLPKDSLYGVRLQPKKIPSWSLYKKALPVVLFNFTVLALPTGFGAYYYLHPASPRNTTKSTGLYPFLPPAVVLLRDVIICVLVEEVLFYYFHRLFHHPALYATFHKKHHEFTAPISMSGKLISFSF
ncbi:hypothetical protein DSO57_1010962 [Entomophthora muscae]|uniref:Uncharacterized protein n=1 Tax=Entomophthora muscae TaxID=34485 RepID=A0ACC2THF9_9FUNG|nr:hypothetical protein DSO57_1010962 [Entomophthora muscae]